MRKITLLLLLIFVPAASAAAIVGAVRYNTDSSNTNTTSGAVTVTTRTNLNAGVVNATNKVEVGLGGTAPGVISMRSTNGTYIVSQFVDTDGTFVITYGDTNMFSLLVGEDSAYSGAGTLFLSDDGSYKAISSPPGAVVTNININPTDGFLPYRSNATVFGDSPLALGTNTLYAKFGSTTSFLVNSNSGFTGAGTKFLADDGNYIQNPFYFNSGLGFIENVDHTQNQFRIVNTANSGLFVFATAGSQAVTLGTNVTIAPYNPDSTANPAFFFDATADWTTTNLVFRVRDNGGTPLFGIAGDSGWVGTGTKALFDDGTYKSVGVVGAHTRQLPLLRFPDSVDGAGCTYINTNDFTARTFMRPRFSAAGATNANFATFSCLVPGDLNTAVDLTASLKVALVAGDTDLSTYTLGMASVANSASSSPTAANYVTLTVPADGSGAAGDVEGVSGVTLTGWRSSMTAGQWLYIQLQRDGTDASATAEDLLALEITYTSTQ